MELKLESDYLISSCDLKPEYKANYKKYKSWNDYSMRNAEGLSKFAKVKT
jgi:hypothetical protein